MKKLLWIAAIAGSIFAEPALATTPPQPTIIYTKDVFGTPTWTTASIFQNFESRILPAGESYTSPVYLAPGALTGSTAATTNHYLSIGSGGTFTVNFSVPAQYFSFAFDSVSCLDQLVLSFADKTSRTLSGTEILGLRSGTSLTGQEGRVNLDMGGKSGIQSVEFLNTGDCNGFNIDNLASATPEPATWMMMILGFGMVGGALRQRRRTPALRLRAAG